MHETLFSMYVNPTDDSQYLFAELGCPSMLSTSHKHSKGDTVGRLAKCYNIANLLRFLPACANYPEVSSILTAGYRCVSDSNILRFCTCKSS